MRRIILLLSLGFFGIILFLQTATAAPQERRVALVIGNAAYTVGQLRNPAHDAEDMGSTLRKLGFEVQILKNASNQQMEEAVRQFTDKLKKSKLGLFYYSGHGMELDGINYLIPVNARIQSDADVRYGCLNAQWTLERMEGAGNGVNIMILDACRNNPFSYGAKDGKRGLASMAVADGSLVAFATSPGRTASDGSGRNGTYTKYLLQNLATPDLSLIAALMRTQKGVREETNKAQTPWLSTSFTADLFLAGQSSNSAPFAAKGQTTIDRLKSIDLEIDQFLVSYRLPFVALKNPAFVDCINAGPKAPPGRNITVSTNRCRNTLGKDTFNVIPMGLYLVSAARKSSASNLQAEYDRFFFVNFLGHENDEVTLLAYPDANMLRINAIKLGSSSQPLSSVVKSLNVATLYDLLGAKALITVHHEGSDAINDAMQISSFTCILKGSKFEITIDPMYIKKSGVRNGLMEWTIDFPDEPSALLKVLGLRS